VDPSQSTINPYESYAEDEDEFIDYTPQIILFSVVVHLAFLVVLTAIRIDRAAKEPAFSVIAAQTDDALPLETLSDIGFSEQPQDVIGSGAEVDTGLSSELASLSSGVVSEDAAGSGAGEGDGLGPAGLSSEAGIASSAMSSLESPLGEILLGGGGGSGSGPRLSQNLTTPGSAGAGATGAVGAVDRITQEIMLSLEQRRTLVVWLLDSTPSLAAQRKAISRRFDRIYEELGILEASENPAFRGHDSKPLLTAVASFGQSINFLTSKPTDNLAELKKAIASVKTDSSGIENVFSAIFQSATKYRHYRTQSPRRNIMFVVLTDEAGDDEAGIDPTIAACRKFEIPIYVIGTPAPFGSREALMKYMPPDGFQQEVMWVPVHQGPESYRAEVIQLNSNREFQDPLDSGFGPYGLTRLCYETGGIYFAVHPNRNSLRKVRAEDTALLSSRLSYFFDPEVMRAYRPDYVSTKQYEKLLSENKARYALVKAAQMSVKPMNKPPLIFPKASEGEFIESLTKAQQLAAVVEPRLEMLYQALKQGETDRARLTNPRWQAGYDLAMGRVLASKVRTESYNAMLAKATQGMKFKHAVSDTWELEPSSEYSVSSTLEKQARQAKTYLERVAREHKGTPWAVLAQAELDQQFGWTWQETFTNVVKTREMLVAAMGDDRQPDDQKKMLKRPKPRAPLPRL